MAGAKINTKAKGKDDRSKGSKTMNSTNEESEDHDFSLLRKPVLTSITGFAQARKIFDFATEELKSLLANECDLLYECKVCRNIFRSLVNFISHKRVYCKEKFNSSVHSHFVKSNTTANELLKIKQIEEAYQESLKVTNLVANEHEDRIPLTKDLTGIMERLTKVKGRYNFDEQQVTLQKIPNSSVAVFQSHYEENKFDNMLTQVQELDNMISRDNAVLESDGSFNVQSSVNAAKTEDNDNVIQISDDDDSDEGRVPKCKICDMQFSTQKTLKFHMKYKHLESRLVYPCPDCFEIFSTSWSVYRHLFKVHRKSAAQIRRLRESIQSKAFRMNNPPAFYEKKKNKPIAPQKISEEERIDQENQAWMDNMEGDGELPRCGGCGRTFERRAALAAHTHTCQPRSRALQRRADKRIEIQIRKDYHKGPTGNPLLRDENKQVNEESQTTAKASERSAEPVEKTRPTENNVEVEEKKPESVPEVKNAEPIEIEPDQNNSQSVENVLEEATMDIIDDRSSDSIDSSEKAPVRSLMEKKAKSRLPFAHQAERSNFAALKLRMRRDVDIEKLLCKKCDKTHDRARDLYEHMSAHYKWMRYACKLCNFKNYDFEKLPEHVKIVHKLKGDSDFYFSTVKAIDGTEAIELAEIEESDVNESSESRRPSRCSSDSSRLSDDSSSSCSRVEGSRKRKMYQNRNGGKKKKDSNDETDKIQEPDASADGSNNIEDSQSPSNVKSFEENSSDIDDIEEKLTKQTIKELLMPSVASRRPVRKKTKPKNEDFEYDLSNLLKMEAQGYRDAQTVTTTKPTTQTKKKPIQEIQTNYDNMNKEHVGALVLLSKKAVDKAAAELKTNSFGPPIFNVQKEQKLPNIFARPMVPKVSRGDKISPRKDATEDVKDGLSSNKLQKIQDTVKELKINKANTENTNNPGKQDSVPSISASKDTAVTENEQPIKSESKETAKTKLTIPAVVPIKFRRQSLEVMKNPIINKNISDFSKAGMKTKILLIKPINRNKDGVVVNTPLKFQTIKLKEQNKGTTSSEESSNDQIVVVKVPKVERSIPRSVPDSNINSQRIAPTVRAQAAANDVDTKAIADVATCPINSSESNINTPDQDNDKHSSSSVDQTNTNSITDNSSSNTTKALDHTEILKNSNNIDTDGCVSHVSNNISEPMDTLELNTITPDSDVVQSDKIEEITELSTSGLQDPLKIQEPSTESGISESCSLPNDAINFQESANMDSAIISNSTPS